MTKEVEGLERKWDCGTLVVEDIRGYLGLIERWIVFLGEGDRIGFGK